MSDTVQTWHYGLMAQHWAEHNTTGPEIAYYQQQIEQYGQLAADDTYTLMSNYYFRNELQLLLEKASLRLRQ